MKYGPELPPDGRRFGWLVRGVQTTLLGAAATVLFVIAFALFLLPSMRHLSPQELYHRTWAEARADAYDTGNYKDWDQWEHKFDGQIKTDDDAIKDANEMLRSTGDHYARLLTPDEAKAENQDANEHFVGIGIKLAPQFDPKGEPVMGPKKDDGPLNAVDAQGNPLIDDVIKDGPAEKAGIKAHDAIASVDGKSMKNASMEELHSAIAGKEGGSVSIVIVRQGQALPPMTIVRAAVKQEKLQFKMLTAANGQKVGYIRLEDFMDYNAPAEMTTAINSLNTDRLIIDLRHNPGGMMPICLQLASLFVEDGTLVSTRSREHNGGFETTKYVLQADGLAQINTDETTGSSSTHLQQRQQPIAAHKQIIILADGRSASAAEMFTAALQQNGRATVTGEQTFGKGIGQSVMPFNNGTEFHITSFRYFTPNGFWLGNGGNGAATHEQFGVTPDNKVVFTKAPGVTFGSPNDNQLNSALEQLSK
jgi:carboxyl-terminal processing protease